MIIDVSDAQTLGANFRDVLPFYDVKVMVLRMIRMLEDEKATTRSGIQTLKTGE